jgi:hypothetical protein
MDYDRQVLPTQTNNGTDCIWAWPNTERDHEWSEEKLIDFTANGLWFAPDCKVSGQTNILPMLIRIVDTHGKQIDLIKQEATSCSHRFAGIRASTYHDKFNKTFIQAQLFAAPLMGKDIGCLTHSFTGKGFINGNFDKSIVAELTHNVITK